MHHTEGGKPDVRSYIFVFVHRLLDYRDLHFHCATLTRDVGVDRL